MDLPRTAGRYRAGPLVEAHPFLALEPVEGHDYDGRGYRDPDDPMPVRELLAVFEASPAFTVLRGAGPAASGHIGAV